MCYDGCASSSSAIHALPDITPYVQFSYNVTCPHSVSYHSGLSYMTHRSLFPTICGFLEVKGLKRFQKLCYNEFDVVQYHRCDRVYCPFYLRIPCIFQYKNAFSITMSLVVSSRFPVALSNYLAALNVSFPTNVTDANSIVVEGCGDEMQNVNCAYNLARAAANVAKADVFRGTDSPFGFSAMFKSDRSKYPVSHYLNMIYDSKGLINLKPDIAHANPPRLACVHQNSATVYKGLQLGYDPWQRCSHPWPAQRSPQTWYAVGTVYIFLCPDFHYQAPAPAGNHCPTVVDNTFVGDVNVFYRNYQMYTLIYELIRFYLQKKSLGIKSLPKEVFDWNHCVAYSVESSLKNPTNLLLYIACRSHLSFFCLISCFNTWV